MAEYAAVSSHVKLRVQRNCVSERCLGPKDVRNQIPRKSYIACCIACCKVNPLSSRSICKLSALNITKLKPGTDNKDNCTKCHCLGTLISDSTATFEWIPVVDQVLLMTSVFLTYMAGVIPVEKSILNRQKSISNDHLVLEKASFSGSTEENGDEVNLTFAWDIVRNKLMDSLNTIESKGSLVDKVIANGSLRPSSLFAIAEAPRFRLLLASFHWLKKEVDDVSGNSSISSVAGPQDVFAQIIQTSCEALCISWLADELSLKPRKLDMALLSVMGEKLNGKDLIAQIIEKSGKKDLYAELIWILRFGSLRKESCYDYNFFTRHGVSVLEDLVISLSDGIASMYVELISVDGNLSNEMNSLGLSLCTLSTRALQRLRNEVVLSQWLYQNMDAVASMYEDRFDLCTLERQVIQDPAKGENENFSWLKNLGLTKSGSTLSPLRFVIISCISVPVRRTKELRALTGWKYYYSLFLEMADISMPMVRTAVAKISEAISFFLVCLIGRSLGLIYTGIRQSLRWK